MNGCRPLTTEEVDRAIDHFALRDKAMFMIGLKAGFRISEVLSVKVPDVLRPDGEISETLTVSRQNMKGKVSSRTVALHRDARLAIKNYLIGTPELDAQGYLFPGPEGKPLSRVQAWRIIKKAFAESNIFGRLGTHTMRKTFADRVYKRLKGDLRKTQEALGHRVITSTASYVSFTQTEIDEAVLEA